VASEARKRSRDQGSDSIRAHVCTSLSDREIRMTVKVPAVGEIPRRAAILLNDETDGLDYLV
jgi:hypothetical protein